MIWKFLSEILSTLAEQMLDSKNAQSRPSLMLSHCVTVQLWCSFLSSAFNMHLLRVVHTLVLFSFLAFPLLYLYNAPVSQFKHL